MSKTYVEVSEDESETQAIETLKTFANAASLNLSTISNLLKKLKPNQHLVLIRAALSHKNRKFLKELEKHCKLRCNGDCLNRLDSIHKIDLPKMLDHVVQRFNPNPTQKSGDYSSAPLKEVKIREEEVAAKYTCKVCPATFSTYRALGSHMKVHNNDTSQKRKRDDVDDEKKEEKDEEKEEKGSENSFVDQLTRVATITAVDDEKTIEKKIAQVKELLEKIKVEKNKTLIKVGQIRVEKKNDEERARYNQIQEEINRANAQRETFLIQMALK